MKITCEHCGSLIDTAKDKKCSNCGAPYSNNSEYKSKKELEARQKEAELKTRQIGNEMAENVLDTFKNFGKIRLVIIFISLVLFAVIAFFAINTFKETKTNIENSTNYNTSSSFNNELMLFKGTQSGFFVDKLLDLVINKNAQNNIHKISVIYKDFNLTTSDEILKMKNDLKDDKNYNVLFNYDSDNYIINITIIE
ncbi:MAG: hypothetical protein IJK67_05605 [Bacilli bacterium]|nr:hypothetical protein [Bacilli bacterium]